MQERVLLPEHRARWGPACGVLFVVILAVSFLITNTPSTKHTPAYLYAYYNKSSHTNSLKISLILADIAVVFGIFFFGYLRNRWGRTDVGDRLAPILLAGAIIFATGGLVFSGTMLALFDNPKYMSPDTVQTLNYLNSDLGALATVIGVSIIMFAAGFIILKTRIMPVWLAWVSFVLAVVGLAGPIGFFAFLGMGVWILIVSFLMWRYEEKLPPGGEAMAPAPVVNGTTLNPVEPGGPFPPI